METMLWKDGVQPMSGLAPCQLPASAASAPAHPGTRVPSSSMKLASGASAHASEATGAARGVQATGASADVDRAEAGVSANWLADEAEGVGASAAVAP